VYRLEIGGRMSFLRPRFPGERALVSGIAVDAVGSGMYVPFSLVFFRHVTGLPLSVIGLVLTVTGLVGIAAVPVVGIAVDRFGARTMQISLYVVRGLSFACFPLADALPVFAVVALLTSLGSRAFPPPRKRGSPNSPKAPTGTACKLSAAAWATPVSARGL